MNFKISLLKMAIKWTPKSLILWVANIRLKGIAELIDFSFDLEARKSYVRIKLFGEAESIEVWLEDFVVVNDEGSYKFILHQAQSNRLWLDNLLSRIVGKEWKIPVMPQTELITELFKVERLEQEDEGPEQEDN
jgi:hypothetical protein